MLDYGRILAAIAVMAIVTYLPRMLPLVLFKRRITNQFVQSFLYYVPYVTLAVMTFPAITTATGSPVAGACAMAAGIAGAWLGLGLLPVSMLCCITVLVLQAVL